MSDKLQRVLEEWFRRAAAAGEPVPDDDEIARSATGTPSVAGTVGAAWQRTVDHFAKQVKFGVHDPIPHLPTELAAPDPMMIAKVVAKKQPADAPVPPSRSSASGSVDRVEALTAELIRWKTEQRSAHPESFALAQLKDKQHLRAIAIADARTTTEIARVLPHSAGFQQLVPDLVRVIARFHESSNSSASDNTHETGSVSVPDVGSGSTAWVVSPPAAPRLTAPAPAAAAADTGADFDVDPDGFAPAPRAQGAGQAPDMNVSVTETKGVFAAWRAPAVADAFVLYRVVAMDDSVPWSPEVGRLVTVTTGTQCQDDAEFSSAVRYYTVWANTGATVAEAKAAQPVAVARGRAIALVRDFDPREEDGSVIAKWSAPGALRVHVYRVPLDRAADGRSKPQFRIQADRLNLTGFQDTECERGRGYLYQALVEVEIDGNSVLSDPVDREVRVHAVLEPVTDLAAVLHGSESAMKFDLQWTQPPAGEVVIFRTKDAPPSGLGDEERVVSQIEDYGKLTLESRLAWPAEVVDGAASVTDVPWPKEWAWAHFTPATMIGERVSVGPTVTKVRVEQIDDAELHERVNEQLMTFTWPSGATRVRVFRTAQGIPAEAVVSGASEDRWELTPDTWQKEGGFRFPAQLDAHGCSVHLLPVAYHEGRTYPGRPTTVDYRGLFRISYAVEWRRSRSRTVGTLAVTLTSAADAPHPPQFFLVANNERFPLDSRDGHPLPVTRKDYDGMESQRILTPDSLGPQAPKASWEVDLDDVFTRTGWTWFYLRLFADLPADQLHRVAVLDPPLDTLIVVKP